MKKHYSVLSVTGVLIALIVHFPGLMMAQDVFIQHGKASYYADRFQGRLTANGERYDGASMTAAHLTLPFGTWVRVTNKANNQSVTVRINDRGPFVEGRIIDLSKAAARQLDFISQGVTEVKLELMGPATEEENSPASQSVQAVEEDEYYQVSVSRTRPSGYGIQIGSFRELVNLMRMTDALKKTYRDEITVQVGAVNQVKVYRIIIGQKATREEAQKILEKLKREYPDAFVYDFNQ